MGHERNWFSSSVFFFLGLLCSKYLLLSRYFYSLTCLCLAKKNFCVCLIAVVWKVECYLSDRFLSLHV